MANYLYNGVEFAELPKWDTEKYPFAYIVYYPGLMGWLYAFSEKKHLDTANNSGTMCTSVAAGETYLTCLAYPPIFGEIEEVTATENKTMDSKLLWANYNVLNADGTLYLPASDPIPVLNPTAILMGYSMGAKL